MEEMAWELYTVIPLYKRKGELKKQWKVIT